MVIYSVSLDTPGVTRSTVHLKPGMAKAASSALSTEESSHPTDRYAAIATSSSSPARRPNLTATATPPMESSATKSSPGRGPSSVEISRRHHSTRRGMAPTSRALPPASSSMLPTSTTKRRVSPTGPLSALISPSTARATDSAPRATSRPRLPCHRR